MGVGSVESPASTCSDVSRGALTDKNAIPRYTKALRESPRRAQSGNRRATHHAAPAARRDGSAGPGLACVTHSASRTATSHKRRRYLAMKGSAVRIRASALSPSPGVIRSSVIAPADGGQVLRDHGHTGICVRPPSVDPSCDAACVAAKRIETHASVLTFAGELVRKRKKAVRFPFMDLGTPELRLAACRNEVDLNRRLAPDVYLRVDEIRDAAGILVDAEVVMRRLPDERCLATLVTSGADVTEDLRRIAHLLVAFHTTAGRGPVVDRSGTPDGLRDRWDADLDEWEPFAHEVVGCPTLDRERSLIHRYIAGRTDLLTRRFEGGHIVDGHGDLLSKDIFCLSDGPRILDCLEFDPHLRYGDELADVAFLAMDLESLGRPDLAEFFAQTYQRLAGDHSPESLLHIYMAQRAMVRSKVACLQVAQGDVGAVSSARSHFALCVRHLDSARPLVVVVGGAPGTGKSTLSARLAETMGAVHLRSDEIRRDIGMVGHEQREDRDALDEGLYAAEVTGRTYAALMDRARLLLSGGFSVVLDATFGAVGYRRDARLIANDTFSDVVELECHTPKDVVRERVLDRECRRNDVSEAGLTVARALDRRQQPWPEAHPIDTTLSEDAQLVCAMRHVREAPVAADPL